MMENPFEKAGFEKQQVEYKDLDLYMRDSVALIALNKFKADKRASRQAANHLDGDLIDELCDLFATLDEDTNTDSIILTSAQRFAFCRGAKIELLYGATVEECRDFLSDAQNLILEMMELDTPIVCAHNGLTLGGGLELAFACDYRIASDRNNVLFGLPEASLGIIPGMGGTQGLLRLVGSDVAKEIVSNARVDITTDEALKLNIIDQVVPSERLIEEAYTVAASGQLKKSMNDIGGDHTVFTGDIIHEIKEFLSEYDSKDQPSDRVAPIARALTEFIYTNVNINNFLDGMMYEREIVCYLQQTSDCQEGLKALMEERKAIFKGE